MLEDKYPDYMKTYWRFRNKTGPQCPFCRGTAKNLWAREHDRTKGGIEKILETGNWEDYS